MYDTFAITKRSTNFLLNLLQFNTLHVTKPIKSNIDEYVRTEYRPEDFNYIKDKLIKQGL